jgi:hypothetical protein
MVAEREFQELVLRAHKGLQGPGVDDLPREAKRANGA